MLALLIDIVVFLYMTFLAIVERGTLTGWLATCAVIALATFMSIRVRNT